MDASEVKRFHQLARSRVKEKWGWNAEAQLGETLYEAVLAKEATTLVLGQVSEKYKPAQEMLRACIYNVGGEEK